MFKTSGLARWGRDLLSPKTLFMFLFLVSVSAAADCVDVVKPIALGQCRARPDTKTYIGAKTPEGLWTYRCEYECWTGGDQLEVAIGTHQDYESGEMNSLVCRGVELDMIPSSGGIVQQCRRTVSPLEIFAQGADVFSLLINGRRPFSIDSFVRNRVVSAFAAEMREVGLAYSAAAQGATAADQKALLESVSSDLHAMASVFEMSAKPTVEMIAVLKKYLPFLRRETTAPRPGTQEGFVTTHLNMHRDLILNLTRTIGRPLE